MAKNQHVVPSPNGGWSVRHSGAARATRTFDSQSAAIDFARQKARREGSELYVHRSDGTIRERNSYGNDPHPPRDKR
jgi:hypothetical protein